MQTREQQFAARTYERMLAFEQSLQALDNENKKHESLKARRRYGSLCHKMAVMIRSTGLVQALAFAMRKQENLTFVHDVAIVLGMKQDASEKPSMQLLKQAYTSDLVAYMDLTADTLAALLWFKRFAQAILKVENTDDADAAAEENRNATP